LDFKTTPARLIPLYVSLNALSQNRPRMLNNLQANAVHMRQKAMACSQRWCACAIKIQFTNLIPLTQFPEYLPSAFADNL